MVSRWRFALSLSLASRQFFGRGFRGIICSAFAACIMTVATTTAA